MRIAVITQNDRFVIPQSIDRILSLSEIETLFVAAVDVPGSLNNRKREFLRGFGWTQSSRMARQFLRAKNLDLLDALFRYRLLSQKRSIRAVAKVHNVPFLRIHNPNTKIFIEYLESLNLDLLVSLSAPCKFGDELLKLPHRGCINLHCSLLPRYAGLMPSFWVLFHGENSAGATVHYMDDKIDNGAILAQASVPIDAGMSIFDLIQRTKARGTDLVVTTIRRIQAGPVEAAPNDSAAGSYFSWPTVAQMREFRKRGGRLI